MLPIRMAPKCLKLSLARSCSLPHALECDRGRSTRSLPARSPHAFNMQSLVDIMTSVRHDKNARLPSTAVETAPHVPNFQDGPPPVDYQDQHIEGAIDFVLAGFILACCAAFMLSGVAAVKYCLAAGSGPSAMTANAAASATSSSMMSSKSVAAMPMGRLLLRAFAATTGVTIQKMSLVALLLVRLGVAFFGAASASILGPLALLAAFLLQVLLKGSM